MWNALRSNHTSFLKVRVPFHDCLSQYSWFNPSRILTPRGLRLAFLYRRWRWKIVLSFVLHHFSSMEDSASTLSPGVSVTNRSIADKDLNLNHETIDAHYAAMTAVILLVSSALSFIGRYNFTPTLFALNFVFMSLTLENYERSI